MHEIDCNWQVIWQKKGWRMTTDLSLRFGTNSSSTRSSPHHIMKQSTSLGWSFNTVLLLWVKWTYLKPLSKKFKIPLRERRAWSISPTSLLPCERDKESLRIPLMKSITYKLGLKRQQFWTIWSLKVRRNTMIHTRGCQKEVWFIFV